MRPSRIADQTRIGFMLEATTYVQSLTLRGREVFLRDTEVRNSIRLSIQDIGETAHKLTSQIRETEPDIDWKKIREIRNVFVHLYYQVKVKKLWHVATSPDISRAVWKGRELGEARGN